jgi:DNA-binding NarL/FixJ family response regulator
MGADAVQARLRLVVIDDQRLVREALAAALERLGKFEVPATAGDFDQGRQLIAEQRPHVALLGVLPVVQFFQQVASLLADFPDTRLILLDAGLVDAHAFQALRLGVAGYLTRQQSLADVERAVHEAHQGARVYAPEIAARLTLSRDSARLSPAAPSGVLTSLTPREIDVLVHLAQGYTVKECARLLGISVNTADNHKSRLMRKLKIHKTVDLARLALSMGLLPGAPPAAQPKTIDPSC